MVAAAPRQRRVLLIEDDAWIRTFLRDVLSDEGYGVVEAADGRTGLRAATDDCPDLILLDLAMPEFTGVDVLHGLKRSPRTRSVPVLVLSAFAGVLPDRDAASVAGVLTKPIETGKLLAAIRHALEPTQARQRGALGRPRTRLRIVS
jgi:CheY-like chemotaxis protein